MTIKMIGIDLTKKVFQVYNVDERGHVVSVSEFLGLISYLQRPRRGCLYQGSQVATITFDQPAKALAISPLANTPASSP